MAHEFAVEGGIGGRIPGAYGPDEIDGMAEWVPARPPRDLLEALQARLGSEVDLYRLVLAVLGPLRPALEGPPLGALLAKVPLDLAREVGEAPLALGSPLVAPRGVADLVAVVAELAQEEPWRAAGAVRAVFASARAVVDPEDSEAIAARLPDDLAALWRAAR